ncbi:MAG: fibronectin type III domain-containing protein [bacterium]|nr:fibronectin type III domain-containing protein [bacterium]
MLLGATVANAQFNAILVNELQPLTLACGSGAPVPDGTTVQIFWDSLGNGPTEDDNQPIEGPGFLQVNFNQFNLNGVELLDVPGGFGTDPFFAMASGIPDPAQNTGHPLYWLRVCLGDQGIFWQSDTFRVFTGGITEVYFGVGDDLVPFTCQTGVCAGCPSPPPVETLVASQAFCDSIVVTWSHVQEDIDGYRLLIAGTEPYLYIPNPATTSYTNYDLIGGQDHSFRVRAYRICGTGQDADTAFSTASQTTGRKLVGPPTPQNMTASDNQCGRVLVSWSVNTILGLDSFVVLRDDVPLDTLDNHNAGFVEQFFDNSPLPGVHEYCVRGTSVNCSDGPEACDNGAAGAGPTCTITNVDGSDDDCDEICITWTVTCADADSFEIFRNNARAGAIINTGGPNFTFCYAAPVGTGTFQVRAKNLCGQGTLDAEPGRRRHAPWTSLRCSGNRSIG